MNNLEKMYEMFRLQEQLNTSTNGVDWKSGVTNKGRFINWPRCVRQEASEFIDSFNWKHWKNIEGIDDIENAKIELVDIWHFIMSQYLVDYAPREYPDVIEDSNISQKWWFEKKKTFYERDEIIVIAEDLIYDTFEFNSGNINTSFFELCFALDLTPDELYNLYIGKNALNKFRQDNGYKEGTYIKIWDGKEDNVVMQEILRSGTYTFNELLLALAEKYPKGE